MAGRFTKLAKRIFLFVHITIALLFLLASLAPYLNPKHWWFLSFLGLGFVVFLVLLILFILFWIIFSPRYTLISIVALLIGWKAISVFITLRPAPDFYIQKAPNALRVMHWNVARFREWRRNNNKGSQSRLKMMEQIRRQNADVLCLQEFFHSTNPIYYDNLNYIKKELDYPYHYFSWSNDGYRQWTGQVIFSRYPIVDSGKTVFPRPGLPETLLHADVIFNEDTVRVFTTHLQSVQFKKEDYKSIEEIKNRDDSLLQNSRNIFSKLKRAIRIRSTQAKLVQDAIQESPHPVIVTGDFNDIPNSYTYYTISKGLQDAFLKKGFGIGRTYSGISPTLRIDFILAGQQFEVVQYNRLVKNLSDHYAIIADLQLEQPPAGSAKDSLNTALVRNGAQK